MNVTAGVWKEIGFLLPLEYSREFLPTQNGIYGPPGTGGLGCWMDIGTTTAPEWCFRVNRTPIAVRWSFFSPHRHTRNETTGGFCGLDSRHPFENASMDTKWTLWVVPATLLIPFVWHDRNDHLSDPCRTRLLCLLRCAVLLSQVSLPD